MSVFDPGSSVSETDIAVVGMSGRFPEAPDIERYWKNISEGRECISFFTDEELRSSGVDEGAMTDPNYVKANGYLSGHDLFDAEFFGYSARDAEMMDPQQRIFLECAWEALESSGYNSEKIDHRIGVFAGAGINRYGLEMALSAPHLFDSRNVDELVILNEKDFIATRVAYQLNLKGPCIGVQTACSSSLVAIHYACQSLLTGECDIALAGGVSIRCFGKRGYYYAEEGIVSPDGRCRVFDAKANGTVGGDGAGVVVLKRLADALSDRDSIVAVVKGSAVNNDGSDKIGFTAPSIKGQAAAIFDAFSLANVNPATIGYVEAHGTGTSMGDPIEVAALSEAFRRKTDKRGFCALGSVKSNIGHLDAAAGVAGFIKAALILREKKIPANLHYNEPNREINFGSSPFYVNQSLCDWDKTSNPRRAGVSSFGVGGTNAHLVLEEAPKYTAPDKKSYKYSVVTISAKSKQALAKMSFELADFIERNPKANLSDISYTLHIGRKRMEHWKVIVAESRLDAVSLLKGRGSERVYTGQEKGSELGAKVAFLFSGQGSACRGMGMGLYEEYSEYRNTVDRCSQILDEFLDIDIRKIIAGDLGDEELRALGSDSVDSLMVQTRYAQPALFVLEYALARLWTSWGVEPVWMLGHSVGEFVAACLAGVFSLRDALRLVAVRGRVMQAMPEGVMFAVPLSEARTQELLIDGLSIAAINGAESCVVSGPSGTMSEFLEKLRRLGFEARALRVSHAFHSRMMEPAGDEFEGVVQSIALRPPSKRYISNVTGEWIRKEEAVDPGYWRRHLLEPVRFADGIETLRKAGCGFCLEIGPDAALAALSGRFLGLDSEVECLSSLPRRKSAGVGAGESLSESAHLLSSLSRLWIGGVSVDWASFWHDSNCGRVSLPSYPFERSRYWVDAISDCRREGSARGRLSKLPLAEWFYAPTWKRSDESVGGIGSYKAPASCLLFEDDSGVGSALSSELEGLGWDLVRVRKGEAFKRIDDRLFSINPTREEDYGALVHAVLAERSELRRVIHTWSVGRETESVDPGRMLIESAFERKQFLGCYSIVFLMKAIARFNEEPRLEITTVTSGLSNVLGCEEVDSDKSTLLGPLRVIPQEFSGVSCSCIDVVVDDVLDAVEGLLNEVRLPSGELRVALRHGTRWLEHFDRIRIEDPKKSRGRLRERGIYIVTGGLGNIGFELSRFLAEEYRARLVFVGRSSLPTEANWDCWIEENGPSESVSKKIGRIRELRSLGAEVSYFSADVSDLEKMKGVLQAVEKLYGLAGHGVFHLAGDIGMHSVQLIRELDTQAIRSHFRSKVHGLKSIELLFDGRELDFCVLCSSLSTSLGGVGFAAYSAANQYLDSFVDGSRDTLSFPFLVMDWDGWDFSEELSGSAALRKSLSISPGEGRKAIRKIMSCDRRRVLVSTSDLWSRLAGEELKREERTIVVTHDRPRLSSEHASPSNRTEEKIAEIWKTSLGVSEVGVNDNFLELGGHSLLAIQTIAKMNAAFGSGIKLKDLFGSPTIAEIARLIDRSVSCGTDRIARVETRSHYPTSSQQRRVYFMSQLSPGSLRFNLPFRARIKGRLDWRSLDRGFRALIQRHESLRTNFSVIDDELAQIVREEIDFSIDFEESSIESFSEVDARFSRPFDLQNELLMRVKIVKRSIDEYWLFIDLHHIIVDGASVSILLSDLYKVMLGEALGPLALQYKDYAVWESEKIESGGFEAELAFWRRRLAGASSSVSLPLKRRCPARRGEKGDEYRHEIASDLTESIFSVGREEQSTIFVFLLSVFNVLLYRTTGETDISLCTDSANRTLEKLDRVVGFFVNQIIIRARLDGNPKFVDLLADIRNEVIEANSNQLIPFDNLVDELRPKRESDSVPFGEVMFSFQKLDGSFDLGSGLEVEAIEVGGKTSKRTLSIIYSLDEGCLCGRWIFPADLFRREDIADFAKSFEQLLREVVADRSLRIDEYGINRQLDDKRELLVMNEGIDEKSDFESIKMARRRASSRSSGEAVAISELISGSRFPALVEPSSRMVDIGEWARLNAERVEGLLETSGAVLFRGFGVNSIDKFEEFSQGICPGLFGEYGDLPKETEGERIYHSTPYPADKPILFHNESSHMASWPMRQFFSCLKVAESGGETPIVDCREVYRRLDKRLRGRFEKLGLIYVRNFINGIDVDWRDFFKTRDRLEVERICSESGIECEWINGDDLRTMRRCMAVGVHPKTGDSVFFNQIQLHHPACLEKEVRSSLRELLGEEHFPRNVVFGDGSKIEDEAIDEMVQLYDDIAVDLKWELGDVIVVDNMLVAHGRKAFVGDRKVVVALGDMFREQDCSSGRFAGAR